MIDLAQAISGHPPDVQVNIITEYALHELAIAKYKADVEAGRDHGRGVVVPLTREQRVTRALYLAGERTIADLDEFVQHGLSTPTTCPDIYYLLKDHNGGKDPTAPDPADRWMRPDSPSRFINRTCDCIGGACWCGGWDRFQPIRFAHLYGGWINTDSMIMDAKGPQKCFRLLLEPVPGCYVVCASGSPGHRIGHIGTVVWVPAVWNASDYRCWKDLGVVDVAARTPHHANARTTGVGWYGANAIFVEPAMGA